MTVIFIGMETSGVSRRAWQSAGFETYSCDLLPSQDGGEEMAFGPGGRPLGRHIVGDIFDVLDDFWAKSMWPAFGLFHPDCTYLTGSAAWAFKDGPYHMKLKPGTLTGYERRQAREEALNTFRRIWHLKMRKAVENPRGFISTMAMKPTQEIQPFQFGEDASKLTCLWLDGVPPLMPTAYHAGRVVNWPPGSDKWVERWENQTDGGQNRLSPSDDRWARRADTYLGISKAMVDQWGPIIT